MKQTQTMMFLSLLLLFQIVFSLKNMSMSNKNSKIRSFIKKSSVKTKDLQEFCWKDTYFRNVGIIPSKCSGDKEKIGLLCYSKCPSGYSRFGFDCHQNCPSGWSDQGLFCRHAEYGRGGGYPWKFGDGFSDKGMKKRCENEHGSGKCEKNGAIYYPKCKSGYYSFGCCICRPYAPNCSALGYNSGIDLSCAKKIRIGDPKPMDCESGYVKSAGLCYKQCDEGYTGIGNICWGNAPSGWVDCGMGAAKDSLTCASIVTSQISSVVKLTINVATFGMSISANQSATAAEKSTAVIAYSSDVKKLLDFWTKNKDTFKSIMTNFNAANIIAQSLYDVLSADDGSDGLWDDITIEDVTRIVADLMSIVEPTGVASVVSEYTYPKCSKYFD